MSAVLVDSSVLLDVLTEDPTWFAWSSERLSRCADDAFLAINPIIYAEVSVRFETIEDPRRSRRWRYVINSRALASRVLPARLS